LAFFLIFIVATTAVIRWLYRHGRQRRLDNADRNAPLPAVDPGAVTLNQTWSPTLSDAPACSVSALETPAPVASLPPTCAPPPALAPAEPPLPFAPATPTLGKEHWQEQVRALREAGALDAALTLARAHFPRLHALQQAAVILRRQVRQGIERQQNVATLVGELYDTALVATLSRDKSAPPDLAAFGGDSAERYRALGYAHLKLLNNNDIRYLRQLWGEPERHQRVDAPASPFQNKDSSSC
jgi:hypothetical protein